MAAYTKGPEAHPSYGSLLTNGGLMPIIEGMGFFGGTAQGPIIRSNGYPSPATLPASYSGGATGYGSAAAGGAFNWKLLALLVLISAAGIWIVHRSTWR